MSAANGNVWFGKAAATWRKLQRAPQPAHGVKQKPSRSSSAEMALLTHIDPTRNIDRFYIVEVTPTLFGERTAQRERSRRGQGGTVRLRHYERHTDAQIAEERTIKSGYVQVAAD
jgi:predicted DNA-binding WGR domain protein